MHTKKPKPSSAPKPTTVKEDFGNGISIEWKIYA